MYMYLALWHSLCDVLNVHVDIRGCSTVGFDKLSMIVVCCGVSVPTISKTHAHDWTLYKYTVW